METLNFAVLVFGIQKFNLRGDQKHIVTLLLRNKHVLITLTVLVVTNLLYKILLHNINVIFTAGKTDYRDLINLLFLLFFHLTRKHFKI